MKLIDLTGQRFGRLTVTGRAESRVIQTFHPEGGSTIVTRARWHCVCDCGKETDVDSQSLRMGSTRSCGCLRRERIRERNQGKEKK